VLFCAVLCCAVLCCASEQVQLSNGLPARVSAIDDGEVTLDLNHELAGKHLTFDVTLKSLVPSDALQKATFGAGCFWG
jgi:peptide-methionine (S)-S-oxide reductase